MLAVGGVAVSPSCTPAPNNAPIDGTVAQVIAEQSLLGGLAGGGATTSGFSYSAAQGIAKPDGRPIKTDTTLFRWASPSKTLVGVVAAMLATEGLLDLDADIATIFSGYTLPGSYLVCPDGLAAAARHGDGSYNSDCQAEQPMPPDAKVTLRLLLSHRAGIQHYSNGRGYPVPPSSETADPLVNTGMEWALGLFTSNPLVAVPGSYFAYSTFGFNLAAVVLEHATGLSFASLVQSRIAEPLRLCTLQPDYEWVPNDNRAAGFDSSGSDTGSDDVSWKLGGGGFLSSFDDFVRYGQALMTNTSWLSSTVRSELWADQPHFSAWGWGDARYQYSMGFDQYWSGGVLVNAGHSGHQQKTRTIFWLYPAHGPGPCSLYLMSNSENAEIWSASDEMEAAIKGQLPLDGIDSCLAWPLV